MLPILYCQYHACYVLATLGSRASTGMALIPKAGIFRLQHHWYPRPAFEELTQRDLNKVAYILQTTFSNAFLNITSTVWFKFQWYTGGLNHDNRSALVLVVVRNRKGTEHLAEPINDELRYTDCKSAVFKMSSNVRRSNWYRSTKSISWLLMPWLLTSPGHQQP